MVIIGIDPGTATTGYGMIESIRGKISLIQYGIISTKKHLSQSARLREIYLDLNELIDKGEPSLLAIESLFFQKNAKTAISVAQSRGVILLAAANHNLQIREFTPMQVKINLTSHGKAEKQQVQHMVKNLLGLKNIPQPDDAADALALAICAAQK